MSNIWRIAACGKFEAESTSKKRCNNVWNYENHQVREKITKTINLPNATRMELFRRSPDLDPHILFFTGGGALRRASEEFIFFTQKPPSYPYPVDSGGSSPSSEMHFKCRQSVSREDPKPVEVPIDIYPPNLLAAQTFNFNFQPTIR